MDGKRRRGIPNTSYSSNVIAKWMDGSMEELTRDPWDGTMWRQLLVGLRGAARVADRHS